MATNPYSFLRALTGLALLGLSFVGLIAQEIPLGNESYKELKKAAETNLRLFTDLSGGKAPFDVKNKAQVDAVNSIARYQVFSIAHPPSQVNKIDQGPDMMRRIKDAEDYMKGILQPQSDKNRVNTQGLVEVYFSSLANNAATVAKSDAPIARVNAIRVLSLVGVALSTRDDQSLKGIVEAPLMIKTGDLLLDRLTPILAKSGDDATKIWAIHAIKDALRSNQILREGRPAKSLNQAKEAEALKLVSQVITSPPSYITGSSKGGADVEGYKIMRREAIRALANSSSPILPGDFRPAQILGTCLLETGLNPEPRIDEQVEAAAGLMRATPLDKNDTDYVPEYSIYWMGRFLQTFSREYVEKKSNPLPWKTQAARLSESIENFRLRFPKSKYVQELAAIYLDFLGGIEKGAGEPKPLINIEDKLNALEGNPATPKRFFRSKADSALPEKMG